MNAEQKVAAQRWSGAQYEYFIENTAKPMLGTALTYTPEKVEAHMNMRGSEGWELVSFSLTIAQGPLGQQEVASYIWKRQKQRVLS